MANPDNEIAQRLAAAEAEVSRLTTLLAERDRRRGPGGDRLDRRLLEAIIDSSGAAIISSDEHERITSWNPTAERMFGYTAAEAIGQPFSLIDPLADGTERRDFLERVVTEGEVQGVETRRRRKDGTLIDVETIVSPLHDPDTGAIAGYSSVTRDISERKALERKLRDWEFRYRTFFEEMPGLTYIYEPGPERPNHGVMHVSRQFSELIGYEPDKRISDVDFVDTIVHPDDQERIRALNRRVEATGEPMRAEYRIITRDGRELWVRDSANLVTDDDGIPLYWLGYMIDIGEQKAAEAATAEALARLQASNEELARLSQAKSDFVSMISHEFRTPLTSIQGFSELIALDAESLEEARDFATKINQNAVRLARMVTDVLDLDRLEAGQTVIRWGELDLNQTIGEVIASLEPTTSRHRFVTRLDPALPAIVADADLMVRVLTNLLANAIKYAPAGGEITVATARHPGGVELTVADQGLGIPPEFRSSVFSRYGRIHRPEQTGIAGTGLGLPIARQIVGRHGGEIWVEGNQPAGSVFHVTLPLDCRPRSTVPAPAARSGVAEAVIRGG